jgi:serine/threonine protein kinase
MQNLLSPKRSRLSSQSKHHQRSKSNVIKKLGQLNIYGPEFAEIIQKYEIIEKIGQGSFGKVYKANCKMTKKMVAIKHIKHKYSNEYESLKLIREIEILQFLKKQGKDNFHTAKVHEVLIHNDT